MSKEDKIVFCTGGGCTAKLGAGVLSRILERLPRGEKDPDLLVGYDSRDDAAVYRVQRDAAGESFILTELRAAAGETLYYTDNRAQPGVTYTYRVIPVHAELLDNGILLEGTQSVQVARVEKPSALSRWFSGLFAPKPEEKQEEELPASIFAP